MLILYLCFRTDEADKGAANCGGGGILLCCSDAAGWLSAVTKLANTRTGEKWQKETVKFHWKIMARGHGNILGAQNGGWPHENGQEDVGKTAQQGLLKVGDTLRRCVLKIKKMRRDLSYL